jgi:hypothetical protein
MTQNGWKLEQASFTPGKAAAMTGVDAGLRRQWRKRGFLPQKSGKHGEVPLQEIVWLFALSRCARIGPLRVTAAHLMPVVDYALLELGAASLPWPFVGSSEDEKEFRQSGACAPRSLGALRDLLNIPAQDLHRYLVFDGRDRIFQLDRLTELDTKTSGQVQRIIDGKALAKQVSAVLTKPPFVALAAE